jgi:hypothetical protein
LIIFHVFVCLFQHNSAVRQYTLSMQKYLLQRGVAVLDPWYITQGMYAYDGIHQDLGTNRVYAHAVLRHLKELRDKRLW